MTSDIIRPGNGSFFPLIRDVMIRVTERRAIPGSFLSVGEVEVRPRRVEEV